MREVGVETDPLWVLVQRPQKLTSQVDERCGAARNHVDSAKQLLPGRFDRRLQPDEIGRRGSVAILLGRLPYALSIWGEVVNQSVEEHVQPGIVQRLVRREGLGRESSDGHLATLGQQRVTHRNRPPAISDTGSAFGRGRNHERSKKASEKGRLSAIRAITRAHIRRIRRWSIHFVVLVLVLVLVSSVAHTAHQYVPLRCGVGNGSERFGRTDLGTNPASVGASFKQ